MSPDFRDWSNPNAIARLSAAETRYLVHRTLEAASPATRPWPWRNPAAVWESLAADFDRVANDADASDAMRDFAAAVVRGPRVHGASILVAAAGLHGREAERAMRDALEGKQAAYGTIPVGGPDEGTAAADLPPVLLHALARQRRSSSPDGWIP